jgi:hypothetical protein
MSGCRFIKTSSNTLIPQSRQHSCPGVDRNNRVGRVRADCGEHDPFAILIGLGLKFLQDLQASIGDNPDSGALAVLLVSVILLAAVSHKRAAYCPP